MSSSIVIALPKIEDAKKIRAIFQNHGYSVAAVCNTTAGALASLSNLDYGILICGYHFSDGYYRDILADLPPNFELLLLASGRYLYDAPRGLLTIELPLKSRDLLNTAEMMLSRLERRRKKEKRKPKPRSEREQNYISNAKMLLMQRNGLSEEEAYRYIQKSSMDTGTNMVESAQMILMLIYDEI